MLNCFVKHIVLNPKEVPFCFACGHEVLVGTELLMAQYRTGASLCPPSRQLCARLLTIP